MKRQLAGLLVLGRAEAYVRSDGPISWSVAAYALSASALFAALALVLAAILVARHVRWSSRAQRLGLVPFLKTASQLLDGRELDESCLCMWAGNQDIVDVFWLDLSAAAAERERAAETKSLLYYDFWAWNDELPPTKRLPPLDLAKSCAGRPANIFHLGLFISYERLGKLELAHLAECREENDTEYDTLLMLQRTARILPRDPSRSRRKSSSRVSNSIYVNDLELQRIAAAADAAEAAKSRKTGRPLVTPVSRHSLFTGRSATIQLDLPGAERPPEPSFLTVRVATQLSAARSPPEAPDAPTPSLQHILHT